MLQVKLTRQRQIMEENRSYAQGLQELFTMVLRSAGDDSMYLMRIKESQALSL